MRSIKINFSLFCLCAIWFFSPISLDARHIIGGEVWFDCLGYTNNNPASNSRRYRIFFKMYRDCYGGGAQFDQNIGITIYREVLPNIDYRVVRSNDPQTEFNIQLGQVKNVSPPVYPCLEIPANVCVEDGSYVLEVDLPIISDKYVVVWQRCCRNMTISNILFPDQEGSTFTIDIHPIAQVSGTSSPRFKDLPPTVICVNNPIVWDHSAIDPDGDLLVYEFCTPLSGGGQNGGGCFAVIPNPDCPPPFRTVTFDAPTYTAQFPMGGTPPVTIDAGTGLIYGTPEFQGQYVVSVCVYEYRAGVLLSTVRRDFQFNVTSCERTFDAKVAATQLGLKRYKKLICGTTIGSIQNLSTAITSQSLQYAWMVSRDTGRSWTQVSTSRDLTNYNFRPGGLVKVHMILNPGTNCSDTALIDVQVVPDLTARFDFLYDTCDPGPVQFFNKSFSNFSKIRTYQWTYGNGKVSGLIEPEYKYAKPGSYNVGLLVTDEYGCMNTIQKPLDWFPAPQFVILDPSKREGCVPLNVHFKNLSFPLDDSYEITWTFSDTTVLKGVEIDKVFPDTGLYSLFVHIKTPLNCERSDTFPEYIKVVLPPTGEYEYKTNQVTIDDPIIHIKDISKGTVGRSWLVNGETYFFDENLTYHFKDTGLQTIQMIVVDKYLCTDTLYAYFDVDPTYTYYLPNAFTPNNDKFNDVFLGKGKIEYISEFYMNIYDRWGGKVFHTTDPNQGWFGSKNNEGEPLPAGVFLCEYGFHFNGGAPIAKQQFITLIR